MRHTKAGVRPRRPLFDPAVRAFLAAFAAAALTAAPANAKTTTSTPFWTTERVENRVASMIAQHLPLFARNVRVDSVRCQTDGNQRWFCTVRARKNGRLDPQKYLYTVWIDRGTGGLDGRAIN